MRKIENGRELLVPIEHQPTAHHVQRQRVLLSFCVHRFYCPTKRAAAGITSPHRRSKSHQSANSATFHMRASTPLIGQQGARTPRASHARRSYHTRPHRVQPLQSGTSTTALVADRASTHALSVVSRDARATITAPRTPEPIYSRIRVSGMGPQRLASRHGTVAARGSGIVLVPFSLVSFRDPFDVPFDWGHSNGRPY